MRTPNKLTVIFKKDPQRPGEDPDHELYLHVLVIRCAIRVP